MRRDDGIEVEGPFNEHGEYHQSLGSPRYLDQGMYHALVPMRVTVQDRQGHRCTIERMGEAKSIGNFAAFFVRVNGKKELVRDYGPVMVNRLPRDCGKKLRPTSIKRHNW